MATPPSGTSRLAVHSSYQIVDSVAPLPISKCGSSPCRPDLPPNQTDPATFGPEDKVISIYEGQSLTFGKTVALGSVSTSDNALEQIEVRGHVTEWDSADHTSQSIRFDFPDPYLQQMTDGTGIVGGSDLKPGTNSMAIHRTASDSEGHVLDFTLMVSYTAE